MTIFELFIHTHARMPKFMQTLDEELYKQLQEIANERGITIQELIKAVIIPDWLKQKKE